MLLLLSLRWDTTSILRRALLMHHRALRLAIPVLSRGLVRVHGLLRLWLRVHLWLAGVPWLHGLHRSRLHWVLWFVGSGRGTMLGVCGLALALFEEPEDGATDADGEEDTG